MQLNEKKIWFPAKKYGWGWGPPTCWQGWVVMVVWLIFVGAGAFLLPEHIGLWIGYLCILLAVLIAICWIKGEKPRWRWGGK